ncbi:MAG: acyl-CoA dehydrogenase family protein [Pseudomonadota bacterium]
MSEQNTAAAYKARIAEIGPCLQAGIADSETHARLANSSVTALHEAGLYRLWWPAELGGPGVKLSEAVEVVEALAYEESTCAWNLAIGTIHAGFAGAYLSDDAVRTVFETPPVIAGQLAPIGKAVIVPGGMRVSGQWSFGSGMHQSNWVLGGAMLTDGDQRLGPVVFVAPKEAAVVDTCSWQVAGLSGTGSCDYAIDEAYIPDGYWFRFPHAQRLRGGPVYELSQLAQSLPLHAGLPMGAARRALDEVTALARHKKRSGSANSIAERTTFQTGLATARVKLESARRYMYDCIARLEIDGKESTVLPEARAQARYVTDVAFEVALWAYRQAGGSALRMASPLQHIVRDLMGATQHIFVDEATLTEYGGLLVGDQ